MSADASLSEVLAAADRASAMLNAFTYLRREDGLSPEPPWRSEPRTGFGVRYSDVELVDRFEDRGVATLHVCAYPRVDDPSPVFGFDVVAGRSGGSAVFLDLSPVTPSPDESPLASGFVSAAAHVAHSGRGVDLPDWAAGVFSRGIVAARGLGPDDLRRVCDFALSSLSTWLHDVGSSRDPSHDFSDGHRRYVEGQRSNERTRRSLVALGCDAAWVDDYMRLRLFPSPWR